MREKKKNTSYLKKSPGEKSNTPLFLQFSGRTLSHKKYPFTGHFGNTHAVIPTPEWGGRATTPMLYGPIATYLLPAEDGMIIVPVKPKGTLIRTHCEKCVENIIRTG